MVLLGSSFHSDLKSKRKPETEPVDDVRRAIVSEAWMRVTMMDNDIFGKIWVRIGWQDEGGIDR